MKIVVTGSLGNISKPLTKKLVQKGHSVTVISSSPERQEAIEALGATAVIGNMADADFITAAFSGADAVYCMIPFSLKEADQTAYFKKIGNNYVEAIKQTEIKRAVFLSGWAVDVIRSFNLNDTLNQLPDIAVAELRPGSFYTNLYGYINMIKEKGVIMANYGGEDKVAFVSPEDIATAAAEELTTPFRGRKIRYVASEERTCNEVAKILGEAIGKPGLKWTIISDEQMRNNLIESGIPSQLVDDLEKMQAAIHSGALYADYLDNRPVLGKTKLKDFAKEFAVAFKKG